MQKIGQHVVRDIAQGEGRDSRDYEEPRQRVGRPIADHPDDDGGGRAQAEKPPQVQVVTGQQKDGGDEGHVQADVDPGSHRTPSARD